MFEEEIDLYNNKVALLDHLKQFGLESLIFLAHLSDELQDDKDVVLAFLSINGMQLEYTHEKFKDDKEVVLIAMQQNINAVQYASERLKVDEDIMSLIFNTGE